MTSLEESPIPAADRGAAAAWLPALLRLFIGSGCAALIYEVVWFQLLQLSIGSSAVSLGVLLGIYMGGMCLGSLLLPRYVSPRRHPLRVYAYLELGIGAFGILVLYAVPFLGGIYTAWAGTGMTSLILRALVASICLLPPTLLMGGTLPVVARLLLRRQPRGRGRGKSPRGFLSASPLRHADRHLCRGRVEPDRGADCAVRGRAHRASARADRRRARVARRQWHRLRRHRVVGDDGARRRSDLDAPAVAALRRDHIHVLADPRRVSRGARHRQLDRLGDCAALAAFAHPAGPLPAAAVRRHRVGGAYGHGVDAVLADQSI